MYIRREFLLFVSALFVLGIMDTVSTLFAANTMGTFDNETNEIYKTIFYNTGTLGFVIAKFAITIIFMFIALIISIMCPEVKVLYVSICVGFILVGLLVSLSNFCIAFGGQSISLLSLDILQLGVFGLLLFLTIGMIYLVLNAICDYNFQNGRPMYRDQFGIWMHYDDDKNKN